MLEEFYKYDILKFVPNTSAEQVAYISFDDHPKLSEESRFRLMRLRAMLSGGCFAGATEMFMLTQFVGAGPIVFSLDQRNLEACEHTWLNLHFQDYSQPFPTIVIDLPFDYHQKKLIACKQAGEVSPVGDGIYPDKHYPDFIILHHNPDKKLILMALIFSSQQVYSLGIWAATDADLIESRLAVSVKYPSREDTLPASPEEEELAESCFRLAMNAALFFMRFGYKEKGARNTPHHDRCVRRLALAKKGKGKDRAQAERELRLCPIIYEFKEPVKLYREEKSITKEGGYQVRPHWRRGHQHGYWCGPGRGQWVVKTLLPVLVNQHLLTGENP
jgi:hypothetical protein